MADLSVSSKGYNSQRCSHLCAFYPDRFGRFTSLISWEMCSGSINTFAKQPKHVHANVNPCGNGNADAGNICLEDFCNEMKLQFTLRASENIVHVAVLREPPPFSGCTPKKGFRSKHVHRTYYGWQRNCLKANRVPACSCTRCMLTLFALVFILVSGHEDEVATASQTHGHKRKHDPEFLSVSGTEASTAQTPAMIPRDVKALAFQHIPDHLV